VGQFAIIAGWFDVTGDSTVLARGGVGVVAASIGGVDGVGLMIEE
jgi:hypothetical protein